MGFFPQDYRGTYSVNPNCTQPWGQITLVEDTIKLTHKWVVKIGREKAEKISTFASDFLRDYLSQQAKD